MRRTAWWISFGTTWALVTTVGVALWLGGTWIAVPLTRDPAWLGAVAGAAFVALIVWLGSPFAGRFQPSVSRSLDATARR